MGELTKALAESGMGVQIVFSTLLLIAFVWIARRYLATHDNALKEIKESLHDLREDITKGMEKRVKDLEEWNAKQQGSLQQGNTKFAEMDTKLSRTESKADSAIINKVESDECDRRRDMLQGQIDRQRECIEKCTETMDSVKEELTRGLASIDGSMRILSKYLEKVTVINTLDQGGD